MDRSVTLQHELPVGFSHEHKRVFVQGRKVRCEQLQIKDAVGEALDNSLGVGHTRDFYRFELRLPVASHAPENLAVRFDVPETHFAQNVSRYRLERLTGMPSWYTALPLPVPTPDEMIFRQELPDESGRAWDSMA